MNTRLFLLLSFLCTTLFLQAEGTKEVAPNQNIVINGNPTTDIAALLINNQEYASFAHINNDDTTSQLYINIQDPSQECIYLGFSPGHLNESTPNPTEINFTFVIKDPNGNIVYGPQQVTPGNANINSWNEGFNGPQPLAGSNGYIPITISSSDLESQGWSGSGDYYIQFQGNTSGQGFLIDFWDITVVNCLTTTPEEKKGRIWSYNWALFAVNDFGFPNRPFNGSFYVCAPDGDNHPESFITQIDFNNSGFKPAAFNIAFNSYGTRNTGNIESDRRSVMNGNLTTPEYAIYLNDPVDLCETAEVGSIDFSSIERCNSEEICINIIPSKSGQVEILLDFDANDGVYTEGTADVLLTYEVPDSLVDTEICIPWDGLDGEGNIVEEAEIPLVFTFNQGIYHFPIYDAELMENGFTINRIRPGGSEPLLYYDDSNISEPSGTGEPPVNLSGCNMPCHGWTNYRGPAEVGFGNLNTINSWWFSSTTERSLTVDMPNEMTCALSSTDSLCIGDTDTIFVSLDTIGPDEITDLAYNWNGPSIEETQVDYALINGPGTYTYTLSYVNSIGEQCISECTVSIAEGTDCCTIDLQCPSDMETVSLTCTEDLSTPLESIQDFLDAGFSFGDTTCLNLETLVDESSNNGTGCLNDPRLITRNYTVFHDANDNSLLDDQEASINCDRSYEVIDTVAPEIEFDNPMLDGMESGDTMYLQCRAGEEEWMRPQMDEEDITVINQCDQVNIDFTDTKLEDGNCSRDGFLTRYRCQWDVTDQCGNNTSIYFILEMRDTIAPTFTEQPRDTIIYCGADINIPPPAHDEECCCSDISFSDEFGTCQNGDIIIDRTWTVTDQCGNNSQLIETITLRDTTKPTLTFKNGDLSNGDRITIECVGGSFPEDVELWDENSISASDNCSQNIDIEFSREFIQEGNCSGQALEQWKFNWTATDGCGNQADFNLFVDITDKTPPEIISVPEDDCNGFPDPELYTVSDNCGVPTVNVEVENFYDSRCPEAEKKRYIYTAIDRCGNSSQVSKVYTKKDTTPPSIRLNGFNPNSNGTITIDCNTDKNIDLLYSENAISVSSDCSDTGSKQFTLVSSETSTCSDGIYKTDVLQWDVYDICGNRAQLTVNVNYRDIEPPVIQNFKDTIRLNCIANLPNYTTFSDCNTAFIESDEIDYSDDCSEKVVGERILTISDECNNNREYSQVVIVNRESTLEILNNDPIICESESDKTPILHDICLDTVIEAELVNIKSVENCEEYLSEIREWSITNTCGETITFTQRVLSNDAPEPEITITHPDFGDITDQDVIQLNCLENGLTEENFSFSNFCDAYSGSLSSTLLQENCENDIARKEEYVFTVSGACGNQYKESIQVEYIDDTPPQFTRIPEDITITCSDSLPEPEVSAADECSDVTLDFNQIPFTPSGDPGYSRTWIATDECGNRTTALQVFTIQSELECEIEVPEDVKCWSTTEIEVNVSGGEEPYIYDWESINGECIIHHETDEPTANVTILSDSVQVEVTVTDDNGCTTTCSITIDCEEKDSCNEESLTYMKTIGNEGVDEKGRSMVALSDGTYLVGASKEDKTILMNIGDEGNIIWSKEYDFSPDSEILLDLKIDGDGLVYGLGKNESNGEYNRVFYFRFNPYTQKLIWNRYSNVGYIGNRIIEHPITKNYILALNDYPSQDIIMHEVNKNDGSITNNFDKKFNLVNAEKNESIISYNNHFYGCGRYTSINTYPSHFRVGFSKYNINGDEVYSKIGHISAEDNARLYGKDLVMHNESLYLLAQGDESGTSLEETDVFLYKFSMDGDLLWAKRYKFGGQEFNKGGEIIETDDGLIIRGIHKDGVKKTYLLKINYEGLPQWCKSYGGNMETSYHIPTNNNVIKSGNNLLLVGGIFDNNTNTSNIMIMKSDLNGNIVDTCNQVSNLSVDMTIINDANFVDVDLTEETSTMESEEDTKEGAVIDITSNSICSEPCPDERPTALLRQKESTGIKLYPNPSNDLLFISSKKEIKMVSIYTLNGEKIMELSPNAKEVKIRHTLNSGMHLVNIKTEKGIEHKKVIIH